MSASFRVDVFGKKGCDKCTVLNQRIDKLLKKEEWAKFEKKTWDVETETGIVAFAEAEALNPQRIPAMLIKRLNEETGEYEPIENKQPGLPHPVLKDSALYAYVGLQTDYTEKGKGLITPAMITACFEAVGQTIA